MQGLEIAVSYSFCERGPPFLLPPPSRSGVSCSSAESSTRAVTLSGRISYARIDKKVDGVSYEKFEILNLIELQPDLFGWFIDKGLREPFDEISPTDFTGKVMVSQFDYEFGEPKYSEEEVDQRPDVQQAAVRQCRASCSSKRRARSSASASTWATTRG